MIWFHHDHHPNVRYARNSQNVLLQILCSEHRDQRRKAEDLQDIIFDKYPDQLTWVYEHLRKVRKREPSPSAVVTIFKDNHPELWNKLFPPSLAKYIEGGTK